MACVNGPKNGSHAPLFHENMGSPPTLTSTLMKSTVVLDQRYACTKVNAHATACRQWCKQVMLDEVSGYVAVLKDGAACAHAIAYVSASTIGWEKEGALAPSTFSPTLSLFSFALVTPLSHDCIVMKGKGSHSLISTLGSSPLVKNGRCHAMIVATRCQCSKGVSEQKKNGRFPFSHNGRKMGLSPL